MRACAQPSGTAHDVLEGRTAPSLLTCCTKYSRRNLPLPDRVILCVSTYQARCVPWGNLLGMSTTLSTIPMLIGSLGGSDGSGSIYISLLMLARGSAPLRSAATEMPMAGSSLRPISSSTVSRWLTVMQGWGSLGLRVLDTRQPEGDKHWNVQGKLLPALHLTRFCIIRGFPKASSRRTTAYTIEAMTTTTVQAEPMLFAARGSTTKRSRKEWILSLHVECFGFTCCGEPGKAGVGTKEPSTSIIEGGSISTTLLRREWPSPTLGGPSFNTGDGGGCVPSELPTRK
mmetsp:Transcript_18004/g.45388  ORF Transcript_18004/g.45388 Transcript_18004/m.45388 type:complete len:286 (+) Transcript_18004:356-1213(+)